MAKCLSLLVFLFVGLAGISAAFAAPSCVSNATNAELINELNRRLNNGGGPVGPSSPMILSVTCDSGSRLELRLLDSNTGTSKESSLFVGLDCSNYVSSLLHVSNMGISHNLVVSVCDSGSNLYRILVGTNGDLREVSRDFVGLNCKQQALDSNNRLTP